MKMANVVLIEILALLILLLLFSLNWQPKKISLNAYVEKLLDPPFYSSWNELL